LIVENRCTDNQHWGVLVTPDSHPNPLPPELPTMNYLEGNPRGAYTISDQPLADIGR
jgi:hypothetical protein